MSLNEMFVLEESITSRIQVREFNKSKNNGYARIKNFPGASSKELLRYIAPTLKKGSKNIAVLHTGVFYWLFYNSLLQKNSLRSVKNLLSNLINTGKKFQAFSIEKVSIFNIPLNSRISAVIIKTVKKKKATLCTGNLVIYVDKANILKARFFSDGLHLFETGKYLVTSNFDNTVNNFLYTRTRQNRDPSRMFNESSSETIALKHYKNRQVGYLNSNSLRNKVN